MFWKTSRKFKTDSGFETCTLKPAQRCFQSVSRRNGGVSRLQRKRLHIKDFQNKLPTDRKGTLSG